MYHVLYNYILIFSFLASGDSFRTLSARFRVGVSTVHNIILETCSALWDILQPRVMPEPTKDDWMRIEHEFAERWNFPNCIGSLDGKHIMITSPAKSGTLYYNYKGHFSLNLMALVDANYKFISIDVGDYGSNADGAVFRKSAFGQRYLDNDMDVPPPKTIAGAEHLGSLPYVIVADEAFPLKPNIMRPYPKMKAATLPRDMQIFNYRLSRARRIVENCFGILAQRFRLYNRRLQLKPETVKIIVKATCVLHNYLRENSPIATTFANLNPDHIPYLGANGAIITLEALNGYRSAKEARIIRNKFKEYFNSPTGAVSWQDNRVY